MNSIKRLSSQSNSNNTINDVLALFNDFINFNSPVDENENMLYVKDNVILLSDAANASYTVGVWALFYVLGSEFRDTVYTKIDAGIVSINMIKPWHQVYAICKKAI